VLPIKPYWVTYPAKPGSIRPGRSVRALPSPPRKIGAGQRAEKVARASLDYDAAGTRKQKTQQTIDQR